MAPAARKGTTTAAMGHRAGHNSRVGSIAAIVLTVSALSLAVARPTFAAALTALAARQSGGPSSYRLTVAGTVDRGATIFTTVDDFVNVGLVVTSDESNDLAAPSALVPLGQVNPGNRTLPWNLKVNGQSLGMGKYVVALEIFTATGQPSGRPFPPPAILTVSSDGHTSVAMSSASTTETNWLATLIAVIVALAAGVAGGFFLDRRTHTKRSRPAVTPTAAGPPA